MGLNLILKRFALKNIDPLNRPYKAYKKMTVPYENIYYYIKYVHIQKRKNKI